MAGLVGLLVPACFSFSQSYDLWGYDLLESRIFNPWFQFIMPNHDVWLYAVVEPNQYTISFNGNWSSTWTMSDMTGVKYDERVILPENTFIKEWFGFAWWSRDEAWPAEFLDQTWVMNLTTEDWVTVTLYAQRIGENPYIAQYYYENLEWWEDLIWTGILYSTQERLCISTWEIATWFMLLTGECFDINPDWSTEVPYHYQRIEYDLTVMDRGEPILNTWVKYEDDIIHILSWLDIPEWTWNTFTWWDNIPEWWRMPAGPVVITIIWDIGEHTVTFDTDWWTEIAPITGNSGDVINAPSNPTKDWYNFIWWDTEFPITMWWDDITVKAIWEEIKEWKWRSGWWWRWWGWEDSWDDSGWDTGDTWGTWDDGSEWWEEWHGSAPDKNKPRRGMEDLDAFFAYMWAHDMWIIDTSWEDSDPDGYVTRWAMAEMVVKFTENVLGQKITSDIPEKCSWWDAESEWKSPLTKYYAEKSCALGVMWIRMQDFLPNKILDRAEFGTILSRLLWWDRYDVVDATATKLYYTRHLAALSERKIMTQIDNPQETKELRKRAWLMLMRSRIPERRQ